MKKIIVIAMTLLLILVVFTGCTQAERVSYNVSQEADSFNVVRKITVINTRSDDILFTMIGKLSLQDTANENELSLIVQDENGVYHKHFIYLNAWVTYIVEDLGGVDVSEYHYSLNFNPKMWVPVAPDYVD